ncbi:MAG: 50S ribosomal protein L4 [Candidatus Omnitrophica bacterium]|nr:50S ribosomal protein L4 [Candidatus Omnitrophota bacterium]
MKAPVYSKQGKKKGEVVLNPEIYGAHVNERLLELVRNGYAANLRKGTADTKTRKEVRGGGKKPWKQKGTGRARHGSTRSPIWKGGGVTFGPHPRDYSVHLAKETRRSALISALSLKANQKNILVIEEVTVETPKTKEFAEIVKSLPLQQKQTLCLVKQIDEKLKRASRNLRRWVELTRASDVSAYDVMQWEKLVIDQEALSLIESRLLSSEEIAAAAASGETAEKAKPRKKKLAAKKAK